MVPHLVWKLASVDQSQWMEPVANHGHVNPDLVAWALVAMLVSAVIILTTLALDLVALHEFRRRHRSPRDYIDPEQVRPPIPSLRQPVAAQDDWPVPPSIGILIGCIMFLAVPALADLDPHTEMATAIFGVAAAVFLVSLHLEVTRRPEYRPHILDALPLDPERVPRPRPKPGARAPDPCPTHPEWLVLGAIAVALCGVGPVFGEMFGSLSPAATATTDDLELQFAMGMFVLFLTLSCAVPLIDHWTSRHAGCTRVGDRAKRGNRRQR